MSSVREKEWVLSGFVISSEEELDLLEQKNKENAEHYASNNDQIRAMACEILSQSYKIVREANAYPIELVINL